MTAGERRRPKHYVPFDLCVKRPEHGGDCDTADSRALRSLARFMGRHGVCLYQERTMALSCTHKAITCWDHEPPETWRLPAAYRAPKGGR